MKLIKTLIFLIAIVFISPAMANPAKSIYNFKTTTIEQHHHYKKISTSTYADYPKIIPDQPSQAITKINDVLKNFVASNLNSFLSQCFVNYHSFYTDKNFRGDRTEFVGGFMYIDSRFFSANSAIVSLRFDIQAMYPLAANDQNYIRTLNFDAQTGQAIQFSDLFIKNSNYFAVINQLLSNIGDIDAPLSSPQDMDEHLRWNLTNSGLAINDLYFHGKEHIIIPYSKLKNIMKPYWYKRLTSLPVYKIEKN